MKFKIKVFGIGGGGSNTTDFIVEKIPNVETYAINTDAQALESSKAHNTIHIGKVLTKGLGAGAIPEIGENAAAESKEELLEAIDGADVVFVASGMGGGTGTGAAPYIAGLAKEKGILTIAVVTKPFAFEGKGRMKKAVAGIKKLNDTADVTVVIPNQKLVEDHLDDYLEEAFERPDKVLRNAIDSFIKMLTSKSSISSNIDLNTLNSTLRNQGLAVLGTGHSSTDEYTLEQNLRQAILLATESKMLDISLSGASDFIVLIGGDIETIIASEEIIVKEELLKITNNENNRVSIAYEHVDGVSPNYRAFTVIATGYQESEIGDMLNMTKGEKDAFE